MQRFLSVLGAAVVLAGCGSGGSSGDDEAEQISFTARGGATLGAPEADELVQGTRTVVAPFGLNRTRQLFQNSDYNVPGFEVFYRGVSGEQTILLEIEGDHSKAWVSAGNTTTESNQRFTGARWSSDAGTMPETGEATYNGFYGGILRTLTSTARSESFISGDVRIDVDFGDNTASGLISNRQRYLTANGDDATSDFADISLGPVDIIAGRSDGNGSTGGGGLDQANAVPADAAGVLAGDWSMLLAGEDAAEVVGTVSVRHDYLQSGGGISNDFLETGVFLAER